MADDKKPEEKKTEPKIDTTKPWVSSVEQKKVAKIPPLVWLILSIAVLAIIGPGSCGKESGTSTGSRPNGGLSSEVDIPKEFVLTARGPNADPGPFTYKVKFSSAQEILLESNESYFRDWKDQTLSNRRYGTLKFNPITKKGIWVVKHDYRYGTHTGTCTFSQREDGGFEVEFEQDNKTSDVVATLTPVQ